MFSRHQNKGGFSGLILHGRFLEALWIFMGNSFQAVWEKMCNCFGKVWHYWLGRDGSTVERVHDDVKTVGFISDHGQSSNRTGSIICWVSYWWQIIHSAIVSTIDHHSELFGGACEEVGTAVSLSMSAKRHLLQELLKPFHVTDSKHVARIMCNIVSLRTKMDLVDPCTKVDTMLLLNSGYLYHALRRRYKIPSQQDIPMLTPIQLAH